MSYRELIKVDKYKLDSECASQSERFLGYAERVPPLYEAKLNAELDVKEVEGEAAKQIRRKPKKFLSDPDRITDAKIKEAVEIHPKVKKARRKANKAKAKLRAAESKKEAFDQRRSMIKYLVQLYSDQYWSTDFISPKDTADAKFRKKMRKQQKKKK